MLTVTDVHNTGDGREARPHALIVGSGFGGLAAALRLLARGYRVTVLEKLDAPGGRGYQFKQDGFTFDAGPTIITAPFLFEELWALFGRRMQDDIDLKSVSPFYEVRFADGETFRVSGDPEAMRAEVARFNPADVAGFERFLKRSEEIYRLGFEPMGDAPFDSLIDMARVAPNLLRLEGHRSVYAVVSKYLSDERLRIVFSFHPLLIGGSPFRASSIFCLISYLERQFGVHYAIGGMGALVHAIANLLEFAGRRTATENGSRGDPG